MVKVNGGHAGAAFGQRTSAGRFGEKQKAGYEYRIFVARGDYARAAHCISRK